MDQDELVNKRVHAIARAQDCTIDQVNAALDQQPIELDRDRFLKRTLAMELMRLDQLEMAFEGKALKEGRSGWSPHGKDRGASRNVARPESAAGLGRPASTRNQANLDRGSPRQAG
jgi:hypothetical protein